MLLFRLGIEHSEITNFNSDSSKLTTKRKQFSTRYYGWFIWLAVLSHIPQVCRLPYSGSDDVQSYLEEDETKFHN